MRPLSAIVFHKDQAPAETLANSLRQHFRFVSIAPSYEEACAQVQQHRAQLIIVDLESADVDQLSKLNQEFPATTMVCTHSLISEELCMNARKAGAADCCHISDVRGIVLAASGRNIPPGARSAVA